MCSLNVSDPLLVSVQDEDHGAAGPEHEHEIYNIKEQQQCCIYQVCGFVTTNGRTVHVISWVCDVCVHPLVHHTKREYDIYQMFRIQHRTVERSMYLGAFTVISARLEFKGLMVMAWKLLRRQVAPREMPLDTL